MECVKGLSSSAKAAIAKVQGVLESHEIQNDTRYGLVVKVHTEDERQFKDAIIVLKSIAGITAITVSIVFGGAQ